MPRKKKHTAILDYRFFSFEEFKGNFEFCLKLQSGLPKLVLPFKSNKHLNKYRNIWKQANTIRLGYNSTGIYVDFIFSKEIEYRTSGETLGIDNGYRVPLATSRGELLGTELKNKIEKFDKQSKKNRKYKQIENETNRIINNIDLSNIKVVYLEDLKNVKSNKRGKFSRRINRFLSFWQYAKVISKIVNRCNSEGVKVYLVHPAYTSQTCPSCGNRDKKNRNQDNFVCTKCNFSGHFDSVAATNINIKGTLLAGKYSSCSL